MDLISHFGSFSGYSINWKKSIFVPLGSNFPNNFLESLPFKIVRDHFTYLGLVIPTDPKDIFKLNFMAAIKSLKSTIEKWRILPLSLMALPRFLYLFQNLPIYLTKSFFKNLDSIIFLLIWGFKAHRISKVHLEKSKALGGLAMPVFTIGQRT